MHLARLAQSAIQMCTLVILRRPNHDWPLLLAANRDEMVNRPSAAPGRHWEDRPEVIAGLDITGGGSWLGLNDYGLVTAVLNREGSLGPEAGKRSRGELVLEALDHAEAREAAGALADLHPPAYRPFNLVVADARNAYWLRNGGDGGIRLYPIPPGLHMLSAAEMNDPGYPRIRSYLDRFRRAERPDPDAERWEAWKHLLADRSFPTAAGPGAAMNLDASNGFGTLSSSLLGLPAARPGVEPIWLHADGPPDRTPFLPVPLRRC
jgi:uncharacterized protein with NRDE domain